MTDYDRSAVDTLTGYFYQFDQSILEILNLSSLEDSVAIECIEDIDVKTATELSAIQCKYYSKSEYNHSVIKKAVMHMLNHFKKVTIGEKEAIKYQINRYYKSGQDKIPNSFDIAFLKKNFLTYTEEKVKQEHHVNLGLTDEQLEVFLSYLSINVNCPEYNAQYNQLIDSLCACYKSTRYSAESYYYNNALRIIKDLSINPLEENRTITKKSFLEKVNNSKILFNEWFIKLKGKQAHFKNLKQEYFTSLNIEPFERFFLIEINQDFYIRNELKELIFIISKKWSKISKYGNISFCPYILVHGIENSELISIKTELFKEKFNFIDGYDFQGAEFNPISVAQTATYHNQIKVKVLNVLTDLELTLGSIPNKTKKVYQFFITTPYFEYSDPSIGIHNIQVEHFTDIKEII
ncbi:hypothetical protein QLH32_16025 [Acinetobacter corruptisaponis]|uniref:Uncharacterized protein n=1 Tax=Acinetobacter corruptisaponis TaxID=3045147 RepID=A0ABY8S2F1_9GAMM|nr:DUF4297 family anti-phage-associated protein [Acinetobacter sp. KCTC 92772]WHP05496.1 hypothetical protein QLH32_16025 [Acinetobacter sp. KCTC 92772]